MNDEWLTVRDVAQKLGRSEPTVRRAIRLGALTAYTFGERGYSVAPSDLQTFISKRRKGADGTGDVPGSNQDNTLSKAS